MVFGCFDVVHLGHKKFLRQAKRFGGKRSELVVCLARDKTIKAIKKKAPWFSERERAEIVGALKLVSRVVLGGLGNKYEVINKVKPDAIVLGFDQRVNKKLLRQKIKEFGLRTRVVRLRTAFKPQKLKSSVIKKFLKEGF